MIGDNVLEFWRWFNSISNELYMDIKNERLHEEIDSKVRNLGPFDWEIGPSNKSLLFFAISPNLTIESFNLTKEIIKYAPECENWIFLSSKPKKEYTPVWRMTQSCRPF